MPVVNMFFSTQDEEGKSFISEQIVTKLCDLDYKVLHISYDEFLAPQAHKNYHQVNYTVGDYLYKIASVQEFFKPEDIIDYSAFDFVLLELPSIIKNPFPVKLASAIDHSFLVVRANRSWTEADRNALQLFNEATTGPEPTIVLNGVKVLEMETVLGELPKKRSRFRRWLKRLVQMRFFSKTKVS